jgi:hypothetical protein
MVFPFCSVTPFAFFVLTLCGACYVVTFWLEVLRLLSRGMELHVINWRALPAVIGFVLHTVFLYQQHIAAEQPIGGAAMFFLASAWGLIFIYLLWLCY